MISKKLEFCKESILDIYKDVYENLGIELDLVNASSMAYRLLGITMKETTFCIRSRKPKRRNNKRFEKGVIGFTNEGLAEYFLHFGIGESEVRPKMIWKEEMIFSVGFDTYPTKSKAPIPEMRYEVVKDGKILKDNMKIHDAKM